MINELKRLVEICRSSYCEKGRCVLYKNPRCVFISGTPIKWDMKTIESRLKKLVDEPSTSTNTTKDKIISCAIEFLDKALNEMALYSEVPSDIIGNIEDAYSTLRGK